MWAVENRTPFADNHTWVRDRTGAEVWLVAIRATFVIHADGAVSIADAQEPVCLAPRYRGEPGQSSLLYDTDLAHTKTTTDVLVHGHAYAPRGEPATQVDVTLKLAGVEKTLRVHGDRTWEKGIWGLSLSSAHPFTRLPLIYERAFGGADRESSNPAEHSWDERNTVGTGFAVAASHLKGKRAPNIEYPEAANSSSRDRPRPAGFGPIPSDWLPRRGFGGTYDEKWKLHRLPLLPDDFDERFYQCAPADQQTPSFLRGGEPVELRNLTPLGLLQFRLPRVAFGFETYFSTGERIAHQAKLHTVILEPDVPRVMLVWHTQLPCHQKVLKLERTVITQKQILNRALD